MTERVLVAKLGGVATISLNRPEAMNALDMAMAEQMVEALRNCAADRSVRVIILTGAGKAFMAGGDIKWFHAGLADPPTDREATIRHTIDTIHQAIEIIATMEQVVVARVQGACAGFGLSLMAACDLVICAEDAVLSLAYIKIGTSPDGGSTFALPRAVGVKRTMELALLGDRISAHDALAMGLINRGVPEQDLETERGRLAATLAAGPRAALGRTKKLVRGSLNASLREQLDAERDAFAEGFVGPEFAEGVRAFVQKRRAEYPD